MKEKEKLEFEQSLGLRNFEISNFWKRSWFFGALLIAIASGYLEICSQRNPQIPPICISFLIMLISLSQSLMGRGSKYWQERWEYKTKNRESKLKIDITKTENYNGKEQDYLNQCIIDKNEICITMAQRFSVSKLTFLVWDIIFIFCLLLWLNDLSNTLEMSFFQNIDTVWKIIIFHLIIGVYIFVFFLKGKVYENIKKEKIPQKRESAKYIDDEIETLHLQA
jgi:hypothetical protein